MSQLAWYYYLPLPIDLGILIVTYWHIITSRFDVFAIYCAHYIVFTYFYLFSVFFLCVLFPACFLQLGSFLKKDHNLPLPLLSPSFFVSSWAGRSLDSFFVGLPGPVHLLSGCGWSGHLVPSSSSPLLLSIPHCQYSHFEQLYSFFFMKFLPFKRKVAARNMRTMSVLS